MSSSVGESKAAQREELASAREDYRKRETELMKKHNKQIRQITENHMKALEELKTTNTDQLTRFKRKSNETMTRRDQNHQKQIEEMRKAFLSKNENVRMDAARKVKDTREFSANEKERLVKTNNQRNQRMSENYQTSMSDQKALFDEKLHDYRNTQKSSINSQREQLQTKHDADSKRTHEQHQGEMDDVKNSFDRYRLNAQHRLRDQELRHHRDQKRFSDLNVAQVNRERAARSESETNLREGFKLGLERQRNEFADARKKEEQANSRVGDSFKSNVQDRVDNEVRKLKIKVADLKTKNSNAEKSAKRKAHQEIDGMRRAFQDKYESLIEQRELEKQAFNKNNAKDINKITKEKDKLMVASGRFYKDRMATENRKHRDAYLNLKESFDIRSKQLGNQATDRVKITKEKHMEQEVRLRDNFQKSMDMVKDSNRNERGELRTKLIQEKEDSLRDLREYVNKAEASSARRMASTINKFKKRINDLNDQSLRERRVREKREKQLITDMKRAKTSELDSQRTQYEEKLRAVNDTHNKELNNTNRRHQAQMDELLRTVRTTKA